MPALVPQRLKRLLPALAWPWLWSAWRHLLTPVPTPLVRRLLRLLPWRLLLEGLEPFAGENLPGRPFLRPSSPVAPLTLAVAQLVRGLVTSVAWPSFGPLPRTVTAVVLPRVPQLYVALRRAGLLNRVVLQLLVPLPLLPLPRSAVPTVPRPLVVPAWLLHRPVPLVAKPSRALPEG